MTRDIERRDFLALLGLGVLGAQTVRLEASEPAEDSEPVVDPRWDTVGDPSPYRREDNSVPVLTGTDGDSLWFTRADPFGRPDNPRQGDICISASGPEVYVDGSWRVIGWHAI